MRIFYQCKSNPTCVSCQIQRGGHGNVGKCAKTNVKKDISQIALSAWNDANGKPQI